MLRHCLHFDDVITFSLFRSGLQKRTVGRTLKVQARTGDTSRCSNEEKERNECCREDPVPFPGMSGLSSGNALKTGMWLGEIAVTGRRVDRLAVALLVPELGLPVWVRNVTRDLDARAVQPSGSHQTAEILLELWSVRSGEVELKRVSSSSQILVWL